MRRAGRWSRWRYRLFAGRMRVLLWWATVLAVLEEGAILCGLVDPYIPPPRPPVDDDEAVHPRPAMDDDWLEAAEAWKDTHR